MAKLERRKGTILFTNLTRILGAGDTPDTEFAYVILDADSIKPTLNSQVYISKGDIVDGKYSDFKDGAVVEFTPVEVSEERFQKAISDGKPIRRFSGRSVVIAKAKTTNDDATPKLEPGNLAPAVVVAALSADNKPSAAEEAVVKAVNQPTEQNAKAAEQGKDKKSRIMIIPPVLPKVYGEDVSVAVQTFDQSGSKKPESVTIQASGFIKIKDALTGKIFEFEGREAKKVRSFTFSPNGGKQDLLIEGEEVSTMITFSHDETGENISAVLNYR